MSEESSKAKIGCKIHTCWCTINKINLVLIGNTPDKYLSYSFIPEKCSALAGWTVITKSYANHFLNTSDFSPFCLNCWTVIIPEWFWQAGEAVDTLVIFCPWDRRDMGPECKTSLEYLKWMLSLRQPLLNWHSRQTCVAYKGRLRCAWMK